jgi:hypothetical protein
MMVNQVARAKSELIILRIWAIYHLRGKPGRTCDSPSTVEPRPGFSVSADGQRWIDFTTGERGDQIDFLAKILEVSRPEAYIAFLKLHKAWRARREAKNAAS